MSTVVLIHGLGGSPAIWNTVLPLIEDTVSRVLLPTVGKASSIEAEADAVAEQIGRASEPVVLVGHSMGGLIATALAERYPELVDRLILVSAPPTLASRLSARTGSERALARPVLGEVIWRLIPDAALAKGIAKGFAPGAVVPDAALTDLRKTGRRSFVAASANIDAYLFERNLGRRLSDLACPTDIVFGELDQRVDPNAFVELHNEGHVTTTPIPQVGHMPPWETPHAVADVIRGALSN